jgi:hypothetical protein
MAVPTDVRPQPSRKTETARAETTSPSTTLLVTELLVTSVQTQSGRCGDRNKRDLLQSVEAHKHQYLWAGNSRTDISR